MAISYLLLVRTQAEPPNVLGAELARQHPAGLVVDAVDVGGHVRQVDDLVAVEALDARQCLGVLGKG